MHEDAVRHGDGWALATLDERVRSRLSPVLIEFPSYSPEELHVILTDRARHALAPDSWSPDIIRRLTALAWGDARLAVQTLRQAAASAEEAGNSTVDGQLIEHSLQRWQALRTQSQFARLSEHEKIIHGLVSRNGSIGATELRRLHTDYCRRHRLHPIARVPVFVDACPKRCYLPPYSAGL